MHQSFWLLTVALLILATSVVTGCRKSTTDEINNTCNKVGRFAAVDNNPETSFEEARDECRQELEVSSAGRVRRYEHSRTCAFACESMTQVIAEDLRARAPEHFTAPTTDEEREAAAAARQEALDVCVQQCQASSWVPVSRCLAEGNIDNNSMAINYEVNSIDAIKQCLTRSTL